MTAAEILEDPIMHATTKTLTLASLLLTGLLSPSLAQPAQPMPQAAQPTPAQPVATQSKGGRPCAQITVACKKAGFAALGTKKGVGIVLDCIRPIMQSTPQRKDATKPLPQIDPQLVAACKEQNPKFGTARGAKSQPSG
jgi:hypothetical protein